MLANAASSTRVRARAVHTHARAPQHALRLAQRCSCGIRAANAAVRARAASTVAAGEVTNEDKPEVLRNAAGVQLLSPSLHKQVFGEASSPPLDPKAIQISLEHLHRNKLAQTESKALPTTKFTLPRLQGSSIQEHFYNLGLAHSNPYFDLAKQFAEDNLPPQPDAWVRASGWIRYNQDGSYDTVEYPPDDAMSFDVETMYKVHPFAVMACAASKDNWYAWISPWLLGESEDPQQLIPFASPRPRVLVGHNVGFDRARIQEEYNLERTQNRFLDTMSLHVAITGLSSHQRAPWMKYRKIKAERMKAAAEAGLDSSDIPSTASKIIRWEDVSSMSSLEHVAKLHCNVDLDKSVRDYFSTEDKQEILDNLDDLITYCASDVDVTHRVFKAVLPAFLENCPNPVTFAGVLAMGNSFLPVDKTWPEFIERAERLYRELTEQVESELFKLADQARRLMFTYGKDGVPEWEKDPWLSQMDWSPKKARAFIASPIGSAPPLEEQAEETSSSEAAENTNETEDVDNTSARDLQSETEAVERATAVLEQEASEEGIAPAVASGIEEDEHVADLASADDESVPTWLESLRTSRSRGISVQSASRVVPLLLQMSLHGYPLQHDTEHGWLCVIPEEKPKPTKYASPVDLDSGTTGFKPFKATTRSLLSTKLTKLWDEGILSSPESVAKEAIDVGLSSTEPYEGYEEVEEKILALAERIALTPKHDREQDPWLSQLDWTGAADIPVARTYTKASGTPALQEAISGAGGLSAGPVEKSSKKSKKVSVPAEDDVPIDQNAIIWPKWFWDIYKPKAGETKPNLTLRSRLAPLLLRIRWSNYPIFHSRQHGWVYRIPRRKIKDDQERDESGQMPVIGGTKPRPQEAKNGKSKSKGKGKPDQDIPQQDLFMHDDKKHFYYKLPHKDGSEANVGTPLARPFVPSFEDGTLTSEFEAARAALEMNAKCSYWISARERIMNQMVVWQNSRHGKATEAQTNSHNQGMILPQVVTMGTVTRRAVESTWLAASNAKKNRLGSELKAMVRAPPGYAIVGADVDSEELWICSVMGDAQFGFHGATAIGWMTLEGTKSAGTDLHSKTASIMGISRDQAKVFNYSRLYGAGVKHAVQLLLQGNPKLSKEDATLSAKTLYSATKGERVHKPRPPFNRKMWYGGTESHVFNKLEDVATAADPRTPALGCGITAALAKKNLPATELSKAGEDFMPSRINWVVQSSGVDYLHLLIVSMEYLIKRFEIDARFMLSVHDEIRYLVKEEDKYRAALALQISNLWTRALFAQQLQMQSLPQSCAWFSAVDIDHVLRKEVNMDCVTPSQPIPIPHGVSQDIFATLESTSNTLFKNGRPMSEEHILPQLDFPKPQTSTIMPAIPYRSSDISFLLAQNVTSEKLLKGVESEALSGMHYDWSLSGSGPPPDTPARTATRLSARPLARAPQPKPRSTSASRTATGASRPTSPAKRAPPTVMRRETPVTTVRLRRAPDA